MFIVPGVPGDFPFIPQVRKEISEVEWFPIDDLPKGTYGVMPFIPRVKKWILKEQGRKKMVRGEIGMTIIHYITNGEEELISTHHPLLNAECNWCIRGKCSTDEGEGK